MKLDCVFSAKIHLENSIRCIAKSEIECNCKDETCNICEWNRNIKSTLYDLEKIIEKSRNNSQ